MGGQKHSLIWRDAHRARRSCCGLERRAASAGATASGFAAATTLLTHYERPHERELHHRDEHDSEVLANKRHASRSSTTPRRAPTTVPTSGTAVAHRCRPKADLAITAGRCPSTECRRWRA
jgi:hypothetical protein